jgi:hypothetical protein
MEENKMSKYKESIGVWVHELDGIKHELVPKKSDNIEFLRLKELAQKQNSQEVLFEGIQKLYFDMVMRSEPAMTPKDQDELKDWIGVNIPLIINDMMIAFRWTTKEKLEALEKQAIESGLSSKK